MATLKAKVIFSYKYGRGNSSGSNNTKLYVVKAHTESAVMALIKKEMWFVEGQTEVIIKKMEWL